MKKRNKKALTGVLAVVGWLITLDALSQEFDGLRNSTVLGGSALSHIHGVSATNMAAGSNNLQSNSGVIALGQQASTGQLISQRVHLDNRGIKSINDVVIEDRAYRQAEGWLSINQAAGLGNVQSNTFSVALGIAASDLSDASLQQVQASNQGLSGSEESNSGSSRRVEIDASTFVDARGVIQVSQSAGTGNATRNSFRMNMTLSP